jgi:nucleotide-binding universal stress UspA family protein
MEPKRLTPLGQHGEPSDVGPVIVGVDGSERSIDALALADLLGPALGRDVVIAYVHPFKQLSSLFAPGEYERLVRDVAESTFDQVREHIRKVQEPRMQLVSESSPAAGLHTLAEREQAALIVIGSSHRTRSGRVLLGGTGERLLSGAPTPVAVAPAGFADAAQRIRLLGCGFDGSSESYRALAWAAELARSAAARLRVLSVYERTLPAVLTVGPGLPTASINDVLRRRRGEELAGAVSALASGIDVTQRLLDGNAELLLASESSELDLLVVGSRGYGPLRAALLGSVSSALVRSAQSPLVVVPRGMDDHSADQGTTTSRAVA